MATLIPAISACVSRMTSSERRLAQRLEEKLDNDYLLWYGVPIGPYCAHNAGHAWGDMAILCHDYFTMDLCAKALEQRRLPFNVRKRAGDFNPGPTPSSS